jgi:hypothetical protein
MNLTNSNLLNKHSCATLSGVFETQTLRVCPTEQIICVKELAYGSPKFFPTEKTFLNANIMFNSVPNLQGGVQLNKQED